MARKQKGPTIPELQKAVRDDLREWSRIHRKGAGDPGWPDGTNLNLVRNHVLYEQRQLRELCKAQKVRPCPIEAKLKPPRQVSEDYCAPKSKSTPCRERRAAARKRRRAR